MKNWMHTKGYAALCRQDQDHQYHVKAYWDDRFRRPGERAPKITETFNPRGCYNGVSNWYEKGYVSPTQARMPTFTEDPVAYILAGD